MRSSLILVLVAACAHIDAPTPPSARRDRAAEPPDRAPGHRKPPRPLQSCHGRGHGHGHDDLACTVVGNDGGTIALSGGPTLVIPPGALATDIEITIAVATTTPPAGALTPLYELGPTG